MAVFGAADNHYYRKLAPNTPRYSGTTKKLTRMLTKKLTKRKEEGIPHHTFEVERSEISHSTAIAATSGPMTETVSQSEVEKRVGWVGA